ncbi:hypothetical protein BDV10DRAFT_166450 [Aspergillus recurvatus]
MKRSFVRPVLLLLLPHATSLPTAMSSQPVAIVIGRGCIGVAIAHHLGSGSRLVLADRFQAHTIRR